MSTQGTSAGITRMYPSRGSFLLFLLLILLVQGVVPDSPADPRQEKQIAVEGEEEVYYEIQLVPPGDLEQILSNSDASDTVLKAGPGLNIGIATPRALVIRSDIRSDAYLLSNRNESDMEARISHHLVEIAFGKDNANISLKKDDREHKVWFDAGYTESDIETVLSFARFFNEISATTQFEDEEVETGDLMDKYATVPYSFYTVSIVPRQSLDEYKENRYNPAREKLLRTKQGDIAGFLTNDYVYLWDGLEGEERTSLLTRSLLWSLGFHGETTQVPDSYFSTTAGSTAALSSLDLDAIRLLYGGRLSSGMTKDEIMKALDIPSSQSTSD